MDLEKIKISKDETIYDNMMFEKDFKRMLRQNMKLSTYVVIYYDYVRKMKFGKIGRHVGDI